METATGVRLRDLIILLSAIVGVFGSLGLYYKRRADAANRLRYAFLAEIGKTGDRIYREAVSMQKAELMEDPTAPDESPIVTTTYDENAGELGRLTTGEVQAVTEFYTIAKQSEERIDRAVATPELSPAEAIYVRGRLTELNNLSTEAVSVIESQLGAQPIEIEHRKQLADDTPRTIDEIRAVLRELEDDEDD